MKKIPQSRIFAFGGEKKEAWIREVTYFFWGGARGNNLVLKRFWAVQILFFHMTHHCASKNSNTEE